MHPILFQIGPITIYSYGVLLAIAVVVCSLLLSLDAKRIGVSQDTVFDFMFWLVTGGIIGARIFYIMISWDFYSSNLSQIIMLNQGGLAWQGGFLGGVVAGIWFIRIKKLNLRQWMDLAAPYIALGQAIGRLGCFFNGCCYGKPWAFGIYFPVHQAKLYPTQLFEAGSLLLIFFLLRYYQKSSPRPGLVFVGYLWLAAIERFIVEFYRADQGTWVWGLSLFQYIAVAVFISGIIIFARFRK